MAEVEIDVSLISSFTSKASKDDASSDLKKLLKEWTKIVRGYRIDAGTGKHFVIVDDEEKFSALVDKIKKAV